MTPQEAQELSKQLTEYMLENGETHCLCCHGSMRKSEHTLTSGMVSGLIKFANYCIEFDKREANYRKDLPSKYKLSINEMTNWTKLRFFGLVAKYKVDGVQKSGMWVITRNGWAFLRGDLSLPKFVRTFRNKIVEKCPERIAMHDIMESAPSFPNREDLFSVDPVKEDELALVKDAKLKNKKGKNKCPVIGCDGKMKKKMNGCVNPETNLASIEKYLECPICGYRKNL